MCKNYTFEEAIKRLCEASIFDFEKDNILRKYPQCEEYIKRLGKQRIKALGYKESNLKKEVRTNNDMHKVFLKLETMQDKIKNMTLPVKTVKKLMQRVYDVCGIEKKAKATDLKDYYNLKETVQRIDGKSTKVFTIYECKYKSDIK